MNINVLISHSHKDQKIAKALSEIIYKTESKMSVWFSSDASGDGGIGAGEEWLDTIKKRLQSSDIIIALLTPTGLTRSWIYFESGFGAGKEKCGVIPVCVGIDSLNDIPFPLAMYEAYQLSNYNSLNIFMQKLLAKFGINYNEAQAKPILEEGIQQILQAIIEIKKDGEENFQNPIVTELKQHIDKRLFELTDNSSSENQENLQYSIPFSVNFPNYKMSDYLLFNHKDSVQKVLDNIYYLIARQAEIAPFSYMSKWILHETRKDVDLAISEIGSLIPARYIFMSDSHWEVIPLSVPYNPTSKKSYSAMVRNYKPNNQLE